MPKLLALVLLSMGLLLLSLAMTAQEETEVFFPAVDLTNPSAPFIFTWDYAVAQGASAEWLKMESVVIDAERRKLYMAISRIAELMSDNVGAIQLAENPCGMVMVGDLDQQWNVLALRPLVLGSYDTANQTCSSESIAGADNLTVDKLGNLWIGEDSGLRANNLLWKYEISTGQLLRFASLPAGAEVTGLSIVDETLFLNLQHPNSNNLVPYQRSTIGVLVDFQVTSPLSPIPMPDAERQQTLVVAAGRYQILARPNDSLALDTSGRVLGQFVNQANEPLQLGERTFCANPDGNMFFPLNATMAYLYTNFECGLGGVSKLTIQRNFDSTWRVLEAEMVNFAGVGGTVNNCNASVTPWGTGLTSEEYAPRTADAWENHRAVLNAYVQGTANPYNYGYNVELIPTETGTRLIKHYAMGRRSNEQAWVAPDRRTVYFGDDGMANLFTKFVADSAGDLSSGRLYAARLTQTGTNTTDDFAFTIEWLELGHGNNAEIFTDLQALMRNG